MSFTTKILVIEDEDNIRENIQELLEAKQYLVRTANNGRQGVLEAIDFRPHLILCDIMMPKMDGYKVLEYIRKTSIIQNVPFIFLTAKIDRNDIRQGMELGADDYLTKPFTAKDLVTAIETRLKKQQKIIDEYAKVKHELDTSAFASYYHEFNTPLHGIIGGINLLLSSRTSFNDTQIQELLYSILKSGLRLNHSLANLMLFEEIKRAEVHTELLSMFNSGNSSGKWADRIKTELEVIAREIYNRPEDLVFDMQATDVHISPEYLMRILLELTDNALKFSSKGSKISIKGKPDGDNYFIEIKDSGKGFAIENNNQIAPFKQFNRSKYEQQGLGIGLYLVKRLVEINSGEIKIESEENKGTTITILLPSFGI
ncbi:MAG TPA: response regulator [Chitinophagaceae bacterium]|nr:response regulator [Chitinophagaceae bacterium]MCC6635961.1 response regulator [Chitinophagaceae bacterium]HMZ45531.1 response regulator [Chitinophagaceae bacterium]HNF28700.1 response regulator [Chitinophagaceae bacterium]HNL82340.1 response regulator [Chitinophagaceae bacterium]